MEGQPLPRHPRITGLLVLVNPFAGAGGRLGWKGTDWPLPLRLADRDPWELPAQKRAIRFLEALKRVIPGWRGEGLTACPGYMGVQQAYRAGLSRVEPVRLEPVKWPTTPDDTVSCLESALQRGGVELIVFVGGDGTARLVARVLGGRRPAALGVPGGVKVYSGVFAENPEAAARIVLDYYMGRARPVPRPVLDVDEEAFRSGRLVVKPYATLHVPVSGDAVVPGKDAYHTGGELEEIEEIARYFAEEIAEECTLYILGPGYTVYRIAEMLGVKGKTLLGVDAVHNGRIVGRDLDEKGLLELLREHKHRRAVLVVSPIGAQGYILGRGNQQLSPTVLRAIGLENIVVVATPTKLRKTPVLRVDTGDSELDERLRGHIKVLTGYGRYRIVKVR